MKILQTHVYRGANLWAPMPVIHLSLDIGTVEAPFPTLTPTFYEELSRVLPAISGHQCSTGGHFIEQGAGPNSLGHVAQHSALALQNLARQKVDGGDRCLAIDLEDATSTCDVIFHYEQQDVGIAAGCLAVRLLESLIQPEIQPNFDFDSELTEFLNLAARLTYGPSTRALVAEAKRRNIPVQRLEDSLERVQLGRGTRALRSLLQLGHGKYQRRVWAPYISTESHLAADIALNKDLTNRLVRNAGLPVPQSIRVKDEQSAVAAARQIGYPVVLKPLDGNHGRGVGVNLQDDAAVRAHYPLAGGETHTGTVLVEKYIPGNTYRILVVGGRAVAVTEEVPAHVIGDGRHTLRQLVQLINADPRRGHGSENLLVRIRLDESAIAMAEEQGYGPDNIPPEGQRVQLVQTAHISLGGISIDRTDEVHPYNAMIAEQAAQVIGLQVAGIDLLAPDIAQSVEETGGAICEVNAGPGLGLHVDPVIGKSRDVARPMVELLFPPGAPSRISIVAVTGTDGRTLTSRIIAHVLSSAGRSVGLATGHSIYLGRTQLPQREMNGVDAARAVLRHPGIEAAVLEIAYQDILCSGLSYDSADVVVITQIDACEGDLNGIATLRAFVRLHEVIANSAGPEGSLVLNADDECCVHIGTRAKSRVVYFSRFAGNSVVEKHTAAGGRAVVLQGGEGGGELYLFDGRETVLLFSGDITAKFGKREQTGLGNALAAAAACAALDLNSTTIGLGLRNLGGEWFSAYSIPNRGQCDKNHESN
jgi:cyanophycin synthetase